jgi:hypothetical protein
MTKSSNKAALVFATLLGTITVLPIAAALADSPQATPDGTTAAAGSTGVYDSLDQFKDAAGHPLPGREYLFDTPN